MKLRLIILFLVASIGVFAKFWFFCAEEPKPDTPPLETIYANVYGNTSAFTISPKEKEEMQESGNAPVYGELTPKGILDVIQYMHEKLHAFFGNKMPKQINFMDVGSGAGKVVLGACIKGSFHKCLGVEYSKERHAVAANAYQKIISEGATFIPKGREVVFINADALTVDMSSMHAIYVSSYCFKKPFMEKLLAKFEKELPDGAIIVTSQALPTQPQQGRLKLIRIFTVSQSWKSDSKAHAYQVGIPDGEVQNDMPANWRASSR
ncbi:MAG: hypothetical protein K0R76_916 [Alphaproteobacteria bacterium]|jgi:hypothetical protein|nr:hypothetical protein [Alphaproteobacteria bacterium]MDF3033962.1 hypothetical protein [Alphaproteobacteria bacterium]